ncbi:MAG: SIMPL domain-containing protein [Vulcanimicrobiaceae bacterium]
MRRLLLAFLALTLGLVTSGQAATVAHKGHGPRMTLTVSASATVTSAPDIANVGIEMDSTNDKAADATGTINRDYETLVKKLAALGISVGDIHTTWYNVGFVPKPLGTATPSPWGPQPGYTARRSMTIRVTKLDTVGHVIDAAVASGAKQISGVTFGLSNDEKAHNEALADAVRKARASANAMAEAAGVHVDHVLMLSSGYVAQPMYQPQVMMKLQAMAQAPAPTQIEPQSLTITASVTITYALRP